MLGKNKKVCMKEAHVWDKEKRLTCVGEKTHAWEI
jgi:hypothetical protein